MKKFILTLFLLFSVFSLSNIMNSNAETDGANTIGEKMQIDVLAEKMAQLEREVYLNNLVQRIEFEAEIIIPATVKLDYIEYMYGLAGELELPTRTVFRLIHTESRFNDTITSPVGAYGFMQLMPDTRSMYYDLLRVDTLNLDRNREDIYIGLNLLSDLHSYWRERGNSESYSWKLSLASYNAGKGNVIKYKGIPPFKETQNFVNFIYRTHSNPEFYANYIKKYENALKNNS